MEIDLSILDNLTGEAGAKENSPEGKSTSEVQNGSDGLTVPNRYIKLEAERESMMLAAEAYKTYQENIKRCGALRTSITKGIQRGEDPFNLLLQAIEAISRMTGDTVFLNANRENLKTIYGALGYVQPLEMRLQEAQGRLTRLESALQSADYESRPRLEFAARAHQQEIQELTKQIKNCKG